MKAKTFSIVEIDGGRSRGFRIVERARKWQEGVELVLKETVWVAKVQEEVRGLAVGKHFWRKVHSNGRTTPASLAADPQPPRTGHIGKTSIPIGADENRADIVCVSPPTGVRRLWDIAFVCESCSDHPPWVELGEALMKITGSSSGFHLTPSSPIRVIFFVEDYRKASFLGVWGLS